MLYAYYWFYYIHKQILVVSARFIRIFAINSIILGELVVSRLEFIK